MIKKSFFVLMLLHMSFCHSITRTEDTAVSNTSPEVVAVSNIAIAIDLAEYGRKNKSPIALLAAAEILGEFPQKPFSSQETFSGTDPEKPSVDKSQAKGTPITHIDLLRDAKGFAKNSSTMLEMIEVVEDRLSETKRGKTAGSSWGRFTCPLNGFYRWNGVLYNGGQPAIIVVRGSGVTNLDIRVYDQRGAPVVADLTPGDACRVSWFPRATARYNIIITNTGLRGNDFTIISN